MIVRAFEQFQLQNNMHSMAVGGLALVVWAAAGLGAGLGCGAGLPCTAGAGMGRGWAAGRGWARLSGPGRGLGWVDLL